MERTASFSFDPVPTVESPPKAVIWTPLQYYDGAGWSALPDREKLEMKPTRWDDQRLRFLDPVDGIAEVFKPVQSGTYDVKCWAKGDCSLGVEGDQRIFIKAPLINDVAVHELPERLPAFHKSWKPLVFLLNDSAATFRVTENLCLVLTKDQQQQVNIRAVDYNGGFCCAHPSTFIATAYGSFAVPGFDALPQCFSIPRMHTAAGDWGFYVHFFPWGFLFIPKSVEIVKPQMVLGAVGLGKKVETVGLLFHPPNLYLEIKLDAPSKTCRLLEAGRDFFVTARKEDETDLVVYLVLDGQLAKYSYSFDLRINKPGKPKHHEGLFFKCAPPPKNAGAGATDRKGAPHAGAGGTDPQQGMAHRFILTDTKQVKVLQHEGSPIGTPKEQLVNNQTIAYMDAEICLYYTHPPALKLCKAFTTVATPAS